ncbi:beta-barrel assembly-enhancing protease [Desulfogranum japonicum]|uniref:beta-barrel assembly-enhancing protease n=1 Tax=Desulfogranum japonicum TaxID=231447 RepID=UPI00048CF246|nr:M48 family metallopeptidase [Desulfogranum japonicum]
MFNSLKRLICVAAAIAIFWAPVQSQALTIGEERAIGEQLLYSVRAQFTVFDDPDISRYINNLGQQVLVTAGPQYFDYHFFVVLSDQFNAFAAPGGLVFFYSGLIETMHSEDELLSVLAHEIGHVVSRHIASRVDKSTKVGAASLALGLAGLALGVPALSQGLLAGSMAAAQTAQLQYSRQDEEQADRLSFQWMQEMHRNPNSMEGMLRTMRRITRYSSSKVPQYLLTHPNPEARIGYVQSLLEMDDRQSEDYYEKTNNFAFLRFKYRVLLHAIDRDKMRISCANTIASGKDAVAVTMAHFGMALLETEDHNYEQAFNHLQIVQEAYPDEHILEIDRAVIYLASNQVKQAEEILSKVLHTYQNDTYAMYQLSQAEYRLGNLDAAAGLLKRISYAMPEYAQMYYDLGKICSDQGKASQSRFNLAKYHLYQGRVKEAKQYFEGAAKDKDLTEDEKNEAQQILEKLKELEKKG